MKLVVPQCHLKKLISLSQNIYDIYILGQRYSKSTIYYIVLLEYLKEILKKKANKTFSL